ncbi:probable transcription factor At3g04930 [Solanum dulcamara]|uniref:probable transcription factor At3g04930 n=1 Tax=Solanum dulcamara TaxID=45834 RepID=UPI002485EA0F|nr:probable transcription factor At3g04930 [Solanum dulcamara]
MASVENQHAVVYNDDDLDDDEDDEAQNEVAVDEDDDVDVDDEDDDSTSSPPAPVSNHSGAGEVTIAVVGVPAASDSFSHESKRQQINQFGVTPASTIVVEEKRPLPLDDSRKLFQRLWMDDDEIELLQGFLEYTTQRGGINSSSHHHHDTGAFYDQIKNKLQLDFNKNQLVEKLRRLKKKYRTVMSKMGSGKEFVFKSPHDQATFEISRKIWSNAGPIVVRSSGPPPPEDGGFDDEDSHHNLNNANFIDHSPNFNVNPNGIDVKTPKSRKRSRGGAINVEEKPGFIQQYYQPFGGGTNVILPPMAGPQASLIEETVRSCVSPIFKELLNNLNGSRCFGFGMALGPSPTPLGFGISTMSSDIKVDEKWRKQQILELEVYSKRLELIQDQIKAQLEELRSMTS